MWINLSVLSEANVFIFKTAFNRLFVLHSDFRLSHFGFHASLPIGQHLAPRPGLGLGVPGFLAEGHP